LNQPRCRHTVAYSQASASRVCQSWSAVPVVPLEWAEIVSRSGIASLRRSAARARTVSFSRKGIRTRSSWVWIDSGAMPS
jgi:hypothetical protein